MKKSVIKSKVTKALRNGIKGTKKDIEALVSDSFTDGKLYEAYILAKICRKLIDEEGCCLTLIGSTKVMLKSSPGPINPSYPHIKVEKNDLHFADIWTDIEFKSLSAVLSKRTYLTLGDYHEIDIAVLKPGTSDRPHPEEVLLAIECKKTGYKKSLLRESLGVR